MSASFDEEGCLLRELYLWEWSGEGIWPFKFLPDSPGIKTANNVGPEF